MDRPRPRRALRGVLAALCLLALASCRADPPATQAVPGGGEGLVATVAEVIDGDTLDVTVSGSLERVRLLGVDTPETVHPDRPVECWGPEASARTKALAAPGTRLLLQRDQQARDRFGRLLAYAWLAEDGRFLNEVLLAEGHGELLVIAPNDARRSQLAAAERTARTARLGRWGSCPPPDGGR